MSAISGINSGYSSALSSASPDDVAMGKDDFLKLLVAQLQNQDPMNPSDPTEFTSQLAQFSQLEQLSNANKSLEGLNTMSAEMQRMSALGLVGQEVIAQTDQIRFEGEPLQLGYRTDMPAEDIKIYVLNENGSTLATINATETEAGDHFLEWDGTSDLGLPLEPGNYSLVVRAVDKDDTVLESASLVKGTVTAVDLGRNSTQLETSAGVFAMEKVEKAGATL